MLNERSVNRLITITRCVLGILAFLSIAHWSYELCKYGLYLEDIPYIWFIVTIFCNPIKSEDMVKWFLLSFECLYFYILLGAIFGGNTALISFLFGILCFILLLVVCRNVQLRINRKELEKTVSSLDSIIYQLEDRISWLESFNKLLSGFLVDKIYDEPLTYEKVVNFVDRVESSQVEEDGVVTSVWNLGSEFTSVSEYIDFDADLGWKPFEDMLLTLKFKDSVLVERVDNSTKLTDEDLRKFRNHLDKIRDNYMDRLNLVRRYLR